MSIVFVVFWQKPTKTIDIYNFFNLSLFLFIYAIARNEVSKPEELPLKLLSELYVKVSLHTAPSYLCFFHKFLLLFKVDLFVQTNNSKSFAPFPLQKLHHYYELIRLPNIYLTFSVLLLFAILVLLQEILGSPQLIKQSLCET